MRVEVCVIIKRCEVCGEGCRECCRITEGEVVLAVEGLRFVR